MAKFKIKETEFVATAFIYEVEAETKEEALEKYVNELSGSLELIDSFPVPDCEESIVTYSDET
jgi:hypothetical protein